MVGLQFWKLGECVITPRSNRFVWKLFVLDRNTWNQNCVQQINYQIGIVTWNHIIVYKLLELNNNVRVPSAGSLNKTV